MKNYKIYKALLDKSISSMLAAIEIYNKPNFSYREDTFAILCINAWELILKAFYLKKNNYRINSIYEMQSKTKKDGTPSTIKIPQENRSGNPNTLSIQKIIDKLKALDLIPKNLEDNIINILELRDNSIHFLNLKPISRIIQELGFATIKNYINFINSNDIKISFSKYNFYLMPLAYVDSQIDAESLLTQEVNNYINLIKSKIDKKEEDNLYDIAISIDINFKKGTSINGIGFNYESDGIPVTIKEEDVRKKFPLSYKDICYKCRGRYSNYKQNKKFNKIMNEIKNDEKISHVKKLDETNPKSPQKTFYNSNIFKTLDKFYKKD